MRFVNMGTENVNNKPNAKTTDICQTLCARDYKGWQNYAASGVIECKKLD